jgi:hypothetical protein
MPSERRETAWKHARGMTTGSGERLWARRERPVGGESHFHADYVAVRPAPRSEWRSEP